MGGYVEDSDNIIYHIMNEFETYLIAVCYYHKCDVKTIKNMALESMYVHIRALSDFFSSKKNKEDDLIYSDVMNDGVPVIEVSKDTRTYANKGVVHLTKKRTDLKTNNVEFHNSMKDVVLAIKTFMDSIDACIKPIYQSCLEQQEVVDIRSNMDCLLYEAACLILANSSTSD